MFPCTKGDHNWWPRPHSEYQYHVQWYPSWLTTEAHPVGTDALLPRVVLKQFVRNTQPIGWMQKTPSSSRTTEQAYTHDEPYQCCCRRWESSSPSITTPVISKAGPGACGWSRRRNSAHEALRGPWRHLSVTNQSCATGSGDAFDGVNQQVVQTELLHVDVLFTVQCSRKQNLADSLCGLFNEWRSTDYRNGTVETVTSIGWRLNGIMCIHSIEGTCGSFIEFTVELSLMIIKCAYDMNPVAVGLK